MNNKRVSFQPSSVLPTHSDFMYVITIERHEDIGTKRADNETEIVAVLNDREEAFKQALFYTVSLIGYTDHLCDPRSLENDEWDDDDSDDEKDESDEKEEDDEDDEKKEEKWTELDDILSETNNEERSIQLSNLLQTGHPPAGFSYEAEFRRLTDDIKKRRGSFSAHQSYTMYFVYAAPVISTANVQRVSKKNPIPHVTSLDHPSKSFHISWFVNQYL